MATRRQRADLSAAERAVGAGGVLRLLGRETTLKPVWRGAPPEPAGAAVAAATAGVGAAAGAATAS